MDIASKVKLGASGVTGRSIYDYTDGEIRDAKKEIANRFSMMGLNLKQHMERPEGMKEARTMLFDIMDDNRKPVPTPAEYKAKKDAERKAFNERVAARKIEEAKKKAERKAIEDAKTPAQKQLERKIGSIKNGIDHWQDVLDKAENEEDYNNAEKRLEELKTELANLKE